MEDNGATNNTAPFTNGTEAANAAKNIIKPAKKKKKKKGRGKDSKPRAPRGTYMLNGKPVDKSKSSGGGEPLPIKVSPSENGAISNTGTNQNTQSNKTGHVSTEDMLKAYEDALDPDTVTASDKNKNITPKIEDYTGDHVEDDDYNTTDENRKRGLDDNEPSTGKRRYTGDEFIRMIEGISQAVNPLIVRGLTSGRKKPTRKDFKFTSDDKALMRPSADDIADQIMGEFTPIQQFCMAFGVVELGLMGEWVEGQDISNLFGKIFKKKPKTEDQTRPPKA